MAPLSPRIDVLTLDKDFAGSTDQPPMRPCMLRHTGKGRNIPYNTPLWCYSTTVDHQNRRSPPHALHKNKLQASS